MIQPIILLTPNHLVQRQLCTDHVRSAEVGKKRFRCHWTQQTVTKQRDDCLTSCLYHRCKQARGYHHPPDQQLQNPAKEKLASETQSATKNKFQERTPTNNGSSLTVRHHRKRTIIVHVKSTLLRQSATSTTLAASVPYDTVWRVQGRLDVGVVVKDFTGKGHLIHIGIPGVHRQKKRKYLGPMIHTAYVSSTPKPTQQILLTKS